MKRYKIFTFVVLLIGMGMVILAGLKLADTQKIYQEGDKAYEDIRGQIKKVSETDGSVAKESASHDDKPRENTEELSLKIPLVYIPESGIDIEVLKTINEDSAAWLYSPDTVIDYPVMKADDYNYYLNHLPDGTVNLNGSLFIDYNCAPDFSDRLTVIYGHHMKSGKMFGSLKGYKNQSYYEDNPFMYLYTDKGNYRVDLIYGCVIGAGQWREQAFMFEENVGELMQYAAYNTTFKSDIEYEEGDRVVVLSTCSYEFDEARYAVVGILREEYSRVVSE